MTNFIINQILHLPTIYIPIFFFFLYQLTNIYKKKMYIYIYIYIIFLIS